MHRLLLVRASATIWWYVFIAFACGYIYLIVHCPDNGIYLKLQPLLLLFRHTIQLQRGPGSAAIYGLVAGRPSSTLASDMIEVTVTDDNSGASYAVKALIIRPSPGSGAAKAAAGGTFVVYTTSCRPYVVCCMPYTYTHAYHESTHTHTRRHSTFQFVILTCYLLLPNLTHDTKGTTNPLCGSRCVGAGHCCTGQIAACQMPSCAMGCILAGRTPDVAACKASCAAANNKCEYTVVSPAGPHHLPGDTTQNQTFEMCKIVRV